MSEEIPDYIERSTEGHPEVEEWTGPDADTLLERALQQPGARQRSNGVKFQCPGCATEGHDRSRDNAIVMNDGRFGCCITADHRAAIAAALIDRKEGPVAVSEPEDVHDWLRTFGRF